MSKMKELDLIAQGVADHMKELLYDTVEWQIADQPVEGCILYTSDAADDTLCV